MTLRIRRLLFILFAIAFLIIAPLTAFYAAGYKIKIGWPPNFNQTFQKTGMFIFDTKPPGAKIYLNDKPQRLFFKKYFSGEESYIKTPAKIKNLLPKEYDVKLELAGYWLWQKKLTINPGESTFAEDINLFKKSLPLQITALPMQTIKQAPNKKYFYAINDKVIINADDGEKINIPSISSSNQNNFSSSWSLDSKKIIAENVILNLNNQKKSIDLNEIIGPLVANLRWSNNSNKLYYQYKNSINSFDLNTETSQNLISGENYLDYLIKDDYIFFVSQINKTTKLKSFSLKNKELIREIELPFSPQYELINPEHKFLNLYDAKHQILYLVNPLSFINPLVEIINNIKYATWVDENRLLYANDFEIWLFDLKAIKKTILTRISQPITGILWHPSNNYIIYATDKSVNVIELDERERRNITELIKLDKISSPYLNQKGDILYFMAKIGNQEGLYKLAIQ